MQLHKLGLAWSFPPALLSNCLDIQAANDSLVSTLVLVE